MKLAPNNIIALCGGVMASSRREFCRTKTDDPPSSTRVSAAQIDRWIEAGLVPQPMNRRRAHVYYIGRVQGVGFRYTVKREAAGFEVTGLVRNLPDGRVELIAEGMQEELEGFLQAIRDSGLAHFIRREQTTWSTANNEFSGFEIAG